MTAPGSSPAALERLATALGPGFITTLVTSADRRPRLSVTCRDTRMAEEVHTSGDCYWWPWAERIAATSDPLAAAHRITATLRGSVPAGEQR